MTNVALPAAGIVTGISLCAGIEGIGLGLGLAIPGYRTVCYVERDIAAAVVLAARLEDGSLHPAPLWSDIATFDGAAWRGLVDILTAGVPCQPWSVAGTRRGVTDERWIWPDIARVVRAVEPGCVFLECTPGLAVGGLEHILGDLASFGFAAEWDVFSAAEVGAPQLRERLFLLARHPGRRIGGAVADAGRGREGGSEYQSGTSGGAAATRSGRAAVGDADGGGRQQSPVPKPEQRHSVAHASWAGRLFPPAPNDHAAWAAIIRERPNLALAIDVAAESTLRGMAPGTPGRLDGRNDPTRARRLFVLGNSCVPLVGAHAFLALAERLECD